jgi:hypothetical protein
LFLEVLWLVVEGGVEKADAPTGREEAWDEFTDEEPAGERGRLTVKLSVAPRSSLSL